MMKKEEVDYILDILFDNLVNLFRVNYKHKPLLLMTTNCVPWIIGKPGLALLLKQKDFIEELVTGTILNLLTILLFWCHLEYIKFGIMYSYKHVSQLR